MAPTGLATLILAGALTAAAVVLAVVVWNRGGRLRVLTRAVSILVCEVLFLTTVGVVVNRFTQIYPSWGALFGDVRQPSVHRYAAGALDDWLAPLTATGRREGLAFAWRKAPGALLVSLPLDYFVRTQARFPVIVAIAPADLDCPAALRLSRAAWPAVVVFAAAPGVDARAELVRELRVHPQGWVTVGIGPNPVATLRWARGQLPPVLEPPQDLTSADNGRRVK